MLEFTLTVLASGFAGYRIGRHELLIALSSALCTFLAIISTALIVALSMGLSKLAFAALVIALSMGVIALLYSGSGGKPTRSASSAHVDLTGSQQGSYWPHVVLIAALSLGFPFLYAPIDLSSFDTIHHLGIIKNFIDSDSVSLDIYSLSTLYTHDIVYFAYAGSTYNLIIGFVADALNIDPLVVLTAFTSMSIAFLLLGAYHLSHNMVMRFASTAAERRIIILPILAAFTLFIPHIPSEYVGHPGVYWAAYPSVFALACVFHLLGLLVRFSDPHEKTQWGLLAMASLAAASLHSALTVAAVSYAVGYLCLSVVWNWRRGNNKGVHHGGVQLCAVAIPLAMAIGIKLFAVHGLQTPNLLDAQNPSWLNVSDQGSIFNYKAVAHKRVPLIALSTFVLLLSYLSIFRHKTEKTKQYFRPLIILWTLCLLAVLFMYLPVVTPRLIKTLSAPLMFRILWFLEVILPVLSAALISVLIIRLSQKDGRAYRAAAATSLLASILLGVFLGRDIVRSGDEAMLGVNTAVENYNYIRLSSIKTNEAYVAFLESLSPEDRYFVTSWSFGQGTHKRMEMALTSAQLVTPPHTLTERGKQIAASCALHEADGRARLRQMVTDCDIDYVVSWVWPFAQAADQDARNSQSKLQDPLRHIGHYDPSLTFSISRQGNEPVLVNVYKARELN